MDQCLVLVSLFVTLPLTVVAKYQTLVSFPGFSNVKGCSFCFCRALGFCRFTVYSR